MRDPKTLVEGFLSAVSLFPKAEALRIQEKSLTYRELFNVSLDWANKIMASTQHKSLKRVAIYSQRTLTNYIGTLATLLAGAAFVPLNPRFPAEKNHSILEQCKPDVIIVDKTFSANFEKVMALKNMPRATIFYSDEFEGCASQGDEVLPTVLPTVLPEDIAYILFTSGSTGVPKGVPIKHKNVCSFLAYNQKRYHITERDKISQTFEPTFDLSIFDLFMAWFYGACLISMKPIDLVSPYKYINDNNITVWFSVPSVIPLLEKQGFLEPNSFPNLRLSLFCGEALLESSMRKWAEAAPLSVCENLYGPTELTIACSVYQWNRSGNNSHRNGVLPIGKIYEHMDFVINEGELCVNGEQCFDGYLNASAKSEKNFLMVQKNNAPIFYYRTGDYVEEDANGNLLYLGRQDQQIKINGYRVELGEIESAFLNFSGVERAFAFLLQNHQLGVYVVGTAEPQELLEKAKTRLPMYMIPNKIKVFPEFPLNENGKIDRKYLKACLEIA